MMIEKPLEKLLFASRWLMAPFYLGLVVSLALLMVKFMAELVHLLLNVMSATQAEFILGILSLIDLSLAGNLLLIVIFSGYENFVSKMDVVGHEDRPEWMGKVDFGRLKLRLVASIVAISAIHLLKTFMDVEKLSDRDIMWQVIIHLMFVVSGVLLALMDLLAEKARVLEISHHTPGAGGGGHGV